MCFSHLPPSHFVFVIHDYFPRPGTPSSAGIHPCTLCATCSASRRANCFPCALWFFTCTCTVHAVLYFNMIVQGNHEIQYYLLFLTFNYMDVGLSHIFLIKPLQSVQLQSYSLPEFYSLIFFL